MPTNQLVCLLFVAPFVFVISHAFAPTRRRNNGRSPSLVLDAPIASRRTQQQQQLLPQSPWVVHSSISSSRDKDVANNQFDLPTAVRLAGLAFDAYVEPAVNSSRWERGSSGLAVAFCSAAYTRQLYSGIVELRLEQVTNLPSDPPDQSTAERLLSGSGVDACLLAAILEGGWKEDVALLETEQYHTGVLDLTGAAHVSRTTTCWSSVTLDKAQASLRKNGVALPYHVPASLWNGKGATAVWPTATSSSSSPLPPPPLYLYVQDPATARLVLTVLDDDKLGPGTAIGSTYKRLTDLIPPAGWKQAQLVDELKAQVVEEMKRNPSRSLDDALEAVTQGSAGSGGSDSSKDRMQWKGSLALTSKPRKRDKNGQIWAAAAAGAAIAGPLGAAAGAVMGSLYEGNVQGSVQLSLRYRPIVTDSFRSVQRSTYTVLGGMPGITWGHLYHQYRQQTKRETNAMGVAEEEEPTRDDTVLRGSTASPASDLEHCFFVTHAKTGATCAVYRSLQEKRIIVSFRGTCAPIDLLTDASLIQDAWVEGDDIENQSVPKVHVGFRSSMNSISRRLKELILAVPAPGDDMKDYEMLVTGHSLGAALATLFTADVGQYGLDAGRGLPQLEPSEPWWKSITTVFAKSSPVAASAEPPRPKTLRLYNFGSPRVGNAPFAELVDALRDEGQIDQIYRIVNGEDVVARLPRTVNALVFGNINYEHVGATVLLTQPPKSEDGSSNSRPQPSESGTAFPVLWVEGESDDTKCPVRDGASLISPVAEGSLLGDLWAAATTEVVESSTTTPTPATNDLSALTSRLSTAAGKMTERMKQVKASDFASLVGIDQRFTDRELRLIQSIVQGKALAHHLEDEYYAGMGLACGFLARVGNEVTALPPAKTLPTTTA